VLEEVLGPLDIIVQTDVDVSNDPPEMDVLLIQNTRSPTWTPRQTRYLPDGIRTSRASHIIIEFKYTESVNQDAVQALLGYEIFYRRTHHLKAEAVQGFLVSGRTPRASTRAVWGYTEQEAPGVYRSTNQLLANTPLIVLSELADEPHNVFFKLFARQRAERQAAFSRFDQHIWWEVSPKACWLVRGLADVWMLKGGKDMRSITKEDLMQRGKELPRMILPLITEDEFEELLGDTPYMQYQREKAREEGIVQGMAQGIERGMAQGIERGMAQGIEQGIERGMAQGIEQGHLATRRRVIVETLVARFGMDDQTIARLESRLATITDEHHLRTLFDLALRTESVATFDVALQ
jgi:hypothetical protein